MYYTSRSNSSGPARGRRRYVRAFIPGAVIAEGRTATCSVSALRIALWPGGWKAQFLPEI